MMNALKNLTLSIILITLALSPINFDLQKNTVNAAAPQPVVDAPNTLVSTLNKIANQIQSAIDKAQWAKSIKQFAKDTAFEILKQAVLDRLMRNLIRWIEGGGRGAIVDDWDAFFQDAANRAGGIFAGKISNGMLCSPFNLQVQLALLPVQTFEDQGSCTLNDVIRNIDGFMEDFRDGSWIGYQTIWEPRNNFYGSVIMGMDEKARAEAAAVTAAAAEAAAGRGFLSFKKCDYIQDPKGTLEKVGNNYVPINPNTVGTFIRYSQKCRVTTPGDVAASAFTKALVDVPFIKAETATGKLIASYLAAIVNASVNVLTKSAVDGLRGAVAEATKDTKINPVLPCAGLTGESFRSCMQTVNAEKQEYQSYRDGTALIVSQPLELRFQLAGIYAQSINTQQSFVTSLSGLSTCRQSSDLATRSFEEQQVLDDIQFKFDDNQTYIENIESQTNAVNNAGIGDSLTQEAWTDLGQLSDFSNDGTDGLVEEIASAEEERDAIQAKVAAELPGIELQLQSCPQIVTTPRSNL